MNYILTSKKQNQTRIWTAIDRNKIEIIAFYIGPGTELSARRIWNKMRHRIIEYVYTDGNYSYNTIIPKKIK